MYRGSEEELDDAERAYAKRQRVEDVLDYVFFASAARGDEERLLARLRDERGVAVAAETDALRRKRERRKRKAAREEAEAEEALKAIMARRQGGGGDGDALALIQQRSNARKSGFDSMIASLEAKYGGEGKSKGKKVRGKKRARA